MHLKAVLRNRQAGPGARQIVVPSALQRLQVIEHDACRWVIVYHANLDQLQPALRLKLERANRHLVRPASATSQAPALNAYGHVHTDVAVKLVPGEQEVQRI